jgi:hypothetical protein
MLLRSWSRQHTTSTIQRRPGVCPYLVCLHAAVTQQEVHQLAGRAVAAHLQAQTWSSTQRFVIDQLAVLAVVLGRVHCRSTPRSSNFTGCYNEGLLFV